MGNMIPGAQIKSEQQGRYLVFDEGLTEDAFTTVLGAMMLGGMEFSLYDPKYPSPSDPGAYQ